MQAAKVSDTPLEYIVEYLLKAKLIADQNVSVPEELRENLQKALDIASGLDPYIEQMSSPESDPLAELYKKTISHDWNKAHEDGKTMFRLPKECITGHVEGINILLRYKSPSIMHSKYIFMNTKPCIQCLMNEFASAGEQFDLVFIDADKNNYLSYYTFLLEHNLLRMDGVLCVDNALFKGKVYLSDSTDQNGLSLREFNQLVASDPRVQQVMIPLRDGITLIQRVPYCPQNNAQFITLYYRLVQFISVYHGLLRFITVHSAVSRLLSAGICSMALAADISRAEDVQQMIDSIISKWGGVHIACNNAGINMNSASEDTALDEWDQTFNVNLRGTFMCCQAAGRVMLKQGYGKIINTASMASLIVPHPQKQLAYNTSKAGVVKLTQTLGTEWIDRGVRVNCISPGIVDTPLIHSESLEPLLQRWLSDIPAGRLAQVTDLQAAVVYLASEASDYMTGHNLVIEGGQSLW
uniref:D-arabinitol 2-dehydrogenase [ribulose-forming] n=1 Tax=Astyanax mexicanus TaxID=7994 RepID=A0A8B9JEA8_ASTMX